MSVEEHYRLSGEDIDVIREDLLDGVPSVLIAGDYEVPESVLLRAARGELDYEHDAEHPPLEYDSEMAEWSVQEGYLDSEMGVPDLGSETYTFEDGKLWLSTWQTPPWATDDSEGDEESSDNQSNTNEAEATQPTMTNTTTTDDSSTETELHTTIGRDKNGKTVGGTSPDEFGEIKMEFWPSHIDREDVSTNLQEQVIQTAAMHRDWSTTHIAQCVGCSRVTVANTLKEHWPKHSAVDRQGKTNAAFTVEEVDEVRRRLLAGESRSDLAEEYDVSKPSIENAAKGKSEYMAAAEHPTLVYDRSAGEWLIDGDEPTPDPEPEPEPELEPEHTDEMAVLAYGADIYHHRDESGMPACGAWSDERPSAPLVTLERDEAEEVATECSQCHIATRTSEELLYDIRAELGYPRGGEGTPLYKEELADILLCLRVMDRRPLKEVSE